MAKVLVTGASGFIGKALSVRLQKMPYEVVTLGSRDGDIADPDTLRPWLGTNIVRVFHLAAKTYVPDSWNDPLGYYRTNAFGTVNVLEFCKANAIPLTFVSAYTYGRPEKLPISETSPVRPNNPYALSKHLAEQLCEFYFRAYGLPVTVARPFNVYGARQDNRFLIPTIIRQILFSQTIKVKDLLPKRDYLYIDDFVAALIKTLGTKEGYNVYNFGSGMSLSVKEIIDIAQAMANTDKAVISENAARQEEIDDVVADISKAKRELGWEPVHTFQDGIREIIHSELEAAHE